MTFVCSYCFWHDPYRSRFESDLGKQGDLKTCGLVILLDFGMCNWTPFYSLQCEMHVHKLRSATGSKSIVHCFRLHSYLPTQLSLTRIPFCNDLKMQHNENSSSGTMSYYVPYLHHSGMHRYYISSLRPSVIMTVFFLKKVMIYQFKKDGTYRRFRRHGYSLWLSKVSIRVGDHSTW